MAVLLTRRRLVATPTLRRLGLLILLAVPTLTLLIELTSVRTLLKSILVQRETRILYSLPIVLITVLVLLMAR